MTEEQATYSGGQKAYSSGTDDRKEELQKPLIGWICPVCGRGLSPFTSYCPCMVHFTVSSSAKSHPFDIEYK